MDKTGKLEPIISHLWEVYSTYDHRVWKTGLPVRSAVLKPHAGRLVVGWVTTSESRLLYVFLFVLFCFQCVHKVSTGGHMLISLDTLLQRQLSGPGLATYAPKTPSKSYRRKRSRGVSRRLVQRNRANVDSQRIDLFFFLTCLVRFVWE